MPALDRAEHQLLRRLWPEYFETEEGYLDHDARLPAIARFRDVLAEGGGCSKLLFGIDLSTVTVVTFDLCDFERLCPLTDFMANLTNVPYATLGCLGLALCLVRNEAHPYLAISGPRIQPRFVNSRDATDIGEPKSLLVGKFVTVKGNVVRASSVQPQVVAADFSCPKCGAVMNRRFQEGKYNPPTSCVGNNCKVRGSTSTCTLLLASRMNFTGRSMLLRTYVRRLDHLISCVRLH